MISNGGCAQSCINTPGSYYCTCGSSYILNTDGHTCEGIDITQNDINSNACTILLFIDIDECTVNNGGCEQLCNNSIGSYWCSCTNGYSLDTNNRNCSGYINNNAVLN